MKLLISLALFLISSQQGMMPGPGTPAASAGCTPPTMTYRWTPNSGCSTSVACMTDQVAGNNASQTTSGDLPTYNATGGPNSRPALSFNGTSDFLTFGTAVPSSVTTFTIYVVWNVTSYAGYNIFFSGPAGGIVYYLQQTTGDEQCWSENGGSSSCANNTNATATWYATVLTFTAPNTTQFYKCTTGTCATDGGVSTVTQTLTAGANYIGENPNFSQFFDGSIAEIAILENTASTTGIGTYVNCRYGI